MLVYTYETEKAIVRIHDKPLTEAEKAARKERRKNAAAQFYRSIQSNYDPGYIAGVDLKQ